MIQAPLEVKNSFAGYVRGYFGKLPWPQGGESLRERKSVREGESEREKSATN